MPCYFVILIFDSTYLFRSVCIHAMVWTRRSKENLQESVLPFNLVGAKLSSPAWQPVPALCFNPPETSSHLFLLKKQWLWGSRLSPVVEHLPRVCEALDPLSCSQGGTSLTSAVEKPVLHFLLLSPFFHNRFLYPEYIGFCDLLIWVFFS